MNTHVSETFIHLKQVLELDLNELALIFRLTPDDLKSVELGLLPLDFKNFQRRVGHLKELVDFLQRRSQEESVVSLFKTPKIELGDKSALEVLVTSRNDEAFYNISGYFYRLFK